MQGGLFFQYFFHKVQRPNLINLNRVSERPISGSNCALAQILKHWFKFYVEQTKFESRLMLYKFVKFGLISEKTAEHRLKIGPVQAQFRPCSGPVQASFYEIMILNKLIKCCYLSLCYFLIPKSTKHSMGYLKQVIYLNNFRNK